MFIQLFLCFLSIYLLFSYLLFFPKLLQRLLDDRKSTVEVIKREGEKIAATAEPLDKVKILKQLYLSKYAITFQVTEVEFSLNLVPTF